MSAPELVLDVRGLHVAYRVRGSTVEAVRGVDLTIGPQEVVAVVGESGSGKSTLAHAVIGLLPGTGVITAGRVELDGVELTRIGRRALQSLRGRAIGLVPQDPTVSLNPVVRVGDQVGEVLRIHGLAGRRAAAARAVDLLAEAGLPDPELRARQRPHQLSGGMRQRVLIAIALACRPRLLIADEPTSALDVTVQRHILDHLARLTAEHGTSVLFITHDLSLAADRAQRVVVMSKGLVVEEGPTDQVLRHPEHPYTRKLIASSPSLGRPKVVAVRSGHDRVEARSAVDVNDLVKEFRLPTPGAPVVRAVAGVTLSMAKGRTLGLVGESGSGKTTLARMIVGLERPTSGTVRIDGTDWAALRGGGRRALRRAVQLVYQNPYSSFDPRHTVGHIVDEPLRAFGIGDRATRRARVAELLDHVALPASMTEHRPAELSGGQRQRVAIARALAVDPTLLVCDEPVSALDATVQSQILELLRRLQSELGLTCLFISHDLAVVRLIADDVGVMRDGRLLELAPVEEIFTRPQHEYTRELLAAIPGRLVG